MVKRQEEQEQEFQGSDETESEFDLPEYYSTADYTARPNGIYNLGIVAASLNPGKKTPERRNLNITLEFVDEPESDYIYEMISLPISNDKDRTKRLMVRRLRRFCTAFDLPVDDRGHFNVDDFIGKVSSVPVTIDSKTERNILNLPKY